MLGMGPLMFRNIVGERLFARFTELGIPPAPTRRTNVFFEYGAAARYYRAIDRVTWLHNNRITAEEFVCAAAPLL